MLFGIFGRQTGLLGVDSREVEGALLFSFFSFLGFLDVDSREVKLSSFFFKKAFFLDYWALILRRLEDSPLFFVACTHS